MNYTKNYQLNQWDAADRVLREDFNEDNRKIEEALKEAASQSTFEKIAELYLTGGSRSVTLTLPDINWSHYYQVHFAVHINATGPGNIYLNDGSSQRYQIGAASSVTGTIAKFSETQITPILFLPHYNEALSISCLFLTEGIGYGQSSLPYKDWKTITLYANASSHIITGGTISILGMH